jgi:hypothetical protein
MQCRTSGFDQGSQVFFNLPAKIVFAGKNILIAGKNTFNWRIRKQGFCCENMFLVAKLILWQNAAELLEVEVEACNIEFITY